MGYSRKCVCFFCGIFSWLNEFEDKMKNDEKRWHIESYTADISKRKNWGRFSSDHDHLIR